MQFQYNSDYPGLLGGQKSSDEMPAVTSPLVSDPTEFPPAQPIPCACITTRIYHPSRNQVSTVQNVLVKTVGASRVNFGMRSGNTDSGRNAADTSSMSSDDSSFSSSSDDSMILDGEQNQQQLIPGVSTELSLSAMVNVSSATGTQQPNQQLQEEDRAYWIQRTIREAIYGKVLFAVVLRRCQPNAAVNNTNTEWEVTTEHCAIKEMSWQHIRRERDRLAEDPIKEVAAMQYLRRWHRVHTQKVALDAGSALPNANNVVNPTLVDGVMASFQAIADTNIMMPLDLLSDDRNLYSVMPFCDGGELFERLDLNERFSEGEARYWMDQVLRGIENLQSAGVCHRDMSLENLLVHKSGALIIDLGMCLRIPFVNNSKNDNSSENLSSSFENMNIKPEHAQHTAGITGENHSAINNTSECSDVDDIILSVRSLQRSLIPPQGTCGKWIYMSPEIYKNREPFDGYAVDMWAAGVILFLMLTGFPPWERACATDERFKYMTAGYLVQMLTEWELGISSDAMDLLQRMLWLDPKDRLSLDQVRAHPWMVNGRREPPQGVGNSGMFG